MNAHVTMGRVDLAMEAGLSYLRAVGIDWPPHPSEEEVAAEIARMHALIKIGREAVVDLLLAADEVARSTLDQVLTDFGAPALFYDRNLFQFYVVGTINYSNT